MKQFICIVWIILVGLQTGYQGLVYAYYTLQKEQITEKHCVNKARPTLKCKGKCHLKNMLAANEEDSPSNSMDKSTQLKEISHQPLVGLLQPLTQLSTAIGISIVFEAATEPYASMAYRQRLVAVELLDPPRA